MGEQSFARFKQADLTRAVKGVEAAGMRVGRVEIDPTGNIVIIAADAAPARRGNSLDRFL
ncbi:hypothetical protein ABC347_07985 [Sphingomonas sp. 1P06PA]|uniref:hypothetical protein n=1 Tax=Sphingomonas sp. 1P06PA TaxID=554121 RepID=UPI0039A779F7